MVKRKSTRELIDSLDPHHFCRLAGRVAAAAHVLACLSDDEILRIAAYTSQRHGRRKTLKALNESAKFLHDFRVRAAVISGDLSLSFLAQKKPQSSSPE